MYTEYKDQGFEILAFPCNQFLWQEPGTNAEIEKFAREKKGATFPLFEKIEVNGPGTHDVYHFLKTKTGVSNIDWNFAKFVVDRKGNIEHFKSSYAPRDLEEHLKEKLAEQA